MPGLYASWIEAGQPVGEFWALTPRALALVFRGATARRQADQQALMVAAWLTARLTVDAYHRPAKFPALSRVVPEAGQRRRQSPDQIKAVARQWAALFS